MPRMFDPTDPCWLRPDRKHFFAEGTTGWFRKRETLTCRSCGMTLVVNRRPSFLNDAGYVVKWVANEPPRSVRSPR